MIGNSLSHHHINLVMMLLPALPLCLGLLLLVCLNAFRLNDLWIPVVGSPRKMLAVSPTAVAMVFFLALPFWMVFDTVVQLALKDVLSLALAMSLAVALALALSLAFQFVHNLHVFFLLNLRQTFPLTLPFTHPLHFDQLLAIFSHFFFVFNIICTNLRSGIGDALSQRFHLSQRRDSVRTWKSSSTSISVQRSTKNCGFHVIDKYFARKVLSHTRVR
mmetsp:Transcript_16826/g.45542  ORF Transcript_16826/g.45542 Transcript_16826/m.45542 type:complete len:218 (+) Transcript_16826:126-779(+)